MNTQLEETGGVRLAIEGCGHGHLHDIYASVAEACHQKGWPSVDLLIIGGDFQAVRNAYDLNCVSMPAKYRHMGDFYEYYSDQRTAPYLTVFVGGNHEASNYLFELYYGGWVAPNIYYMGAANVLRLGGVRIAAVSGIWKGYNYRKPHHERLPYNETDIKSIYHVRELDVRKLKQIRTQVDVGISHDWPKGVEWKGNWEQLFRFKKHFEPDARSGQLGSIAAKDVMDWLRPKWWFSAHLHCKYAAVVEYMQKDVASRSQSSIVNGTNDTRDCKDTDPDGEDGPNGSTEQAPTKNEDEIDLDLDGESVPLVEVNASDVPSKITNADELDLELEDDEKGVAPVAPGQGLDGIQVPVDTSTAARGISRGGARAALPESFRRPEPPKPVERPAEMVNETTRFLALDKCLPNRHFLQLMSVPAEVAVDTVRPLKLIYDREWLAITRSFAIDEPLVLGDPDAEVPRVAAQAAYYDAIDGQKLWVDQNLADSDLQVPENFEVTASAYDGGDWNLPQYRKVTEYSNAQTTAFCELLQIPNPFNISEAERKQRMAAGHRRGGQGGSRGGGDSRGRGSGHRGGRGRGRGGFRGR